MIRLIEVAATGSIGSRVRAAGSELNAATSRLRQLRVITIVPSQV